jgi:hypothetical protein
MTALGKKLEDPAISGAATGASGYPTCPMVPGERSHKLPRQFINWPPLSFRFL